jgi:integrase/recombinase XerD
VTPLRTGTREATQECGFCGTCCSTQVANLLQHGVDRPVIALWLGHESMDTMQICFHASLELKEKALAKTEPFRGRPGRYHPPDQLLAFLQAL